MALSYTERHRLAQAAIVADGHACATCGMARPEPNAEGWQWDEIDAMDDMGDTVTVWTCPDCLAHTTE